MAISSNWRLLGDTFGRPLEQYCKTNNILPKKIKSGALMISDVETLERCKSIAIDCKQHYEDDVDVEEVNKELQKVPSHLGNDINVGESENKTDKSMHGNNSFLVATKTDICMNNFLHKMPVCSKFPKNHILEEAKCGEEIFEHIMKTDIGNVNVGNYYSCIPTITPILKRFQKCHKRFSYYSILKDLTKKESESTDFGYQVSRSQLGMYFHFIFTHVVPLSLFGDCRNRKKIQKAVNNLLRTARTESLILRMVIEKLRMSKISWLKPIEDQETRWLIIAKLVTWFFSQFITVVLCTQFYIITSSATGGEKVYIRHAVWRGLKAKFVQKMRRKMAIVHTDSHSTNEPPIGEWMLFPKAVGIRPILKIRCDKRTRAETKMLLKFLEQLYITEYERLSPLHFYNQWNTFIRKKGYSDDRQLYLVSCDVMDAFGSIIQNKLFSIITSLCAKLPDDLRLQWYAVLDRRNVKYESLRYKQYYVGGNLELSIPAGTLFSLVPYMKIKTIKKDWLLNEIEKHIFQQKVQISNKRYLLSKGLAQGPLLSPVLSDIYYSHMVQNELVNFTKCGTLYRYADDFLYITEDRSSAELFLKKIQKGIGKYNCQFKKTKTQTNLYTDPNSPNKIVYLGYSINKDTWDVMPEYSNVNIRYTTSLNRIRNKKNVEVLQSRLLNISALKLNAIVLDVTINSKSAILNTIKHASLLQASRCYALVLSLFDTPTENIWDIFKAIRASNSRLLRVITRFYSKDKDRQAEIIEEVKSLLWKSYKKVFSKNNILCNKFRWLFIRELSLLTCL